MLNCGLIRLTQFAFSLLHSLPKQSWRMHIHQLSVEPDYRRKGVGRRLMYVLDYVARENGISKFVLDSWEFNKESHAFFEQLGYSCFKINMWRETAKDWFPQNRLTFKICDVRFGYLQFAKVVFTYPQFNQVSGFIIISKLFISISDYVSIAGI